MECTSPDFLDNSFFSSDDAVHQKVLYGPGCSEKIGELAKALGNRALVVTDPGIVAAGHPQKILSSLHTAGLNADLFEDSIENPTDSSVQACAREFESCGIDLIIGLGGGSSLDTAKGANFILTNGGSMKQYWGIGKANKPLLPMIAVPTTAGTGSECQSYALISDDLTQRKMACGAKSALPKVTLLDPELTLSQPFSVCTATAFDALAHTLESAVCTKRNNGSHRHAQIGFSLLAQNIEQVWTNPENLEARGAVLLGAAHAGAAIERSMLGAAHALANPLTASRGVIHGQAVSLTLPAVLAFNKEMSEAVKIYSDLARAGGIASEHDSNEDAFGLLLKKVLFLRKLGRLPTMLSQVNFTEDDLEPLARDAAEQWTASFNPRPVEKEDLHLIYQSINSFNAST